MVYKFVFRASALKEFEGLTQGQRKAISEKLKALEADPFAEGKTLEKYAPLRRVKAGDVRVIFDPEADAKGRLIIWRLAGPRGAIAYRQTALTTTIDLQSRISIAASVAIREMARSTQLRLAGSGRMAAAARNACRPRRRNQSSRFWGKAERSHARLSQRSREFL